MVLLKFISLSSGGKNFENRLRFDEINAVSWSPVFLWNSIISVLCFLAHSSVGVIKSPEFHKLL